MKMRFWQKTYIFTLILFLVCLNVGVLSLTVYTYQKNVDSYETAAKAEQYYIAMSFDRDCKDLKESYSSANIHLLMQSYGAFYQSKGISLIFYGGEKAVYSSFAEEVSIDSSRLKHINIGGKRHIVISSEIADGSYTLIYGKNVESLTTEFRSLMLSYALTALTVSLVLAVCLYFVLKKLSAPLEELRKTTESVQNGDFSVRAAEKGNDEFTSLAKSFNSMLQKINEQMVTLEQEAERKQMLVDNMAHEMRTPLTSIHGYAEYIEKAGTTEERRLIAAKYIVSESERLQKISEILLDGAFMRSGDIEMSDVDLKAVAKSVAESLTQKAAAAGVKLSVDASPFTVCGNETMLSMLLYNLVENAIKACDTNGNVKIMCQQGFVAVEDDGKGMTAEQISHITEPFYRTDKSRSRAEGGAGLGLALCKQIADAHSACMQFSSVIDKGTKVTVTFTTRQ